MSHPADEQRPASNLLPTEGPLDDLDDDFYDFADDFEDDCNHFDHHEEYGDDFDDLDDWPGIHERDPLDLPPDEDADERLRQILERLEAAIPDGTPTVWVRIFRAADGSGAGEAEPERVEIDGDLPGLIGYVAPLDCIAVAIVGVGRAHHFEPAPGTAAAHRSTRAAEKPVDVPPGGLSARAICLMDRSGRMAGHTKLEDGTVIPAPPESGRLVDALRRCFRLPTAAAEQPAGELIARLWLANVFAVGEEGAQTLGWKQVRELHPSAEALRSVGVPLSGTTLDRAREVAASAWTWARLRLQATEGDWAPALINPELAAWMDEGMFSRWVLEGTRSTDELLELVRPWVSRSVLTKLAHAVQT